MHGQRLHYVFLATQRGKTRHPLKPNSFNLQHLSGDHINLLKSIYTCIQTERWRCVFQKAPIEGAGKDLFFANLMSL